MIWVFGFIAAAIVALVYEAMKFDRRIASISKTEAMRRILNGGKDTTTRPPSTPIDQETRTEPQSPSNTQ